MQVLERRAVPVLVTLCGLSPLLGGAFPIAIPLRVGAAVLIASAWLMVLALTGRLRMFLADGWLVGVLAVCAVATVVAAALSPVRWDALLWGFAEGTSALYWLACLAIFAGASVTSIGRQTRRATVVGVLVLAAYGLVGSAQRLTGTATDALVLGGSNYVGPLIAMATMVAFGLARTSATGSERSAWYGVAGLSALAVVVTGSAAAVVGLLAAVLGVVLWRPALLGLRGKAVRPVRVGSVIIVALLAIVVLLAGVSDLLPVPIDAVIESELYGTSTTDRLALWRSAFDMFTERPLIGWGPDAFGYGIQGSASTALMSAIYSQEGLLFDPRLTFPQDPHSLPMTLLAELGLFGAAAFGALGITWMRRASKMPEGPERAQDLRASYAFGVLAAMVASLAVPISTTSGLFVIVLAGLAVSGSSSGRDLTPSKPSVVAVSLVVATGLLCSVAMITSGAFGQQAAAAANPRARARGAEMAARFAPGSTLRAYESLWADLGRVGAGLDVGEFIAIYERAPRTVRSFAPYATDLARRLSRAETTPEVLEWADAQLALAVDSAPAYPESLMERAWNAYSLGRDEDGDMYWRSVAWAADSAIFQTYAPEIERLKQ